MNLSSPRGAADSRLLVALIVILILFGGFGYHSGWGWGFGGGLMGLLVLIILLRLLGILSIAIILSAGMLFSGCATDSGDAKADRRGRVTNAVLKDVFNVVLQAGLSYGTGALQGQNGQDAAQAAFLAAAQRNGVNILGDVLEAYAGPQMASIAEAALVKIRQVDPQTPEEKTLLLNTVGAAIQQTANTYFK